ncbi:MAG TPA: OmpA family protein [Polyangiaceae bacterium]|nr:OmpA family protein [Polyangiaceae bacterium]
MRYPFIALATLGGACATSLSWAQTVGVSGGAATSANGASPPPAVNSPTVPPAEMIAAPPQAPSPPAPAAEASEEARVAPVSLGVFGGMFFPSSSHALLERAPQESYGSTIPELGGRLGIYPLPYLGVEVEGATMPTETKSGSKASLWAARASAVVQYPGTLTPFLLVGGGALGAGSNTMGTDVDPALHFGLGAKFLLDNFLTLRFDARDNLTQKWEASQGTQTHHPELLLGLSFELGPAKQTAAAPISAAPLDSDGDGLPDDKDACPSEAASQPDGCPLRDADNDGVFDNKDACPNDAGKAPCGCPVQDYDGDLVIDELDKCPKEFGPIQGCPDPDPDRDAITGAADRCPDKPETKNGFQDADGCPDDLPETVKKFTGVIKGIEFDRAKDTIRPVSTQVLDAAVKVLAEYPNLRVQVTGHTDSDGDRQTNVELSKRRADAVKSYFAGKGVDPTRIETRGAGPDEPIADNKTAEGKQKNRRIEFKLIDEVKSSERGQP